MSIFKLKETITPLVFWYLLAVVGEVNAQIHEVVFAPAGLVNNLLQHRLINLVGDVAKHDLASQHIPAKEVKETLTVVRTSIPLRIRSTSTWL